MSRELTKLRIDEVSAVDAAAGENCKILLRKRDHDVVAKASAALRESVGLILDSDGSEEEKRQELVETFTQFQTYLDREITGKNLGKGVLEREQRRTREAFEKIFQAKAAGDDADDEPDDQAPVGDHHASKVADLLVESGKYPHRAAALDHLLHSASGQALLSRMNKKDEPMDTIYSIMKSSIVGACAAIVAKGSTSLTEHEIVEAVSKVAAERYPGLTEAQAFDRVYSDRGEEGQALRKAVAVAKSMPFQVSLEPLVAAGADAFPSAHRRSGSSPGRGDDAGGVDAVGVSDAYEQLKQIGRQKWPTLSEAQQFVNALGDPVNRVLAEKAHRRPAPTTYYEFPR
jgi:hypothetical protein